MEIAYKNKKDLINELNIYQEMILKKLDELDLISALRKTKSALALIEESQEHFNLNEELTTFTRLQSTILEEKKYQYDRIMRRYSNLLNEELNEDNLENFTKLLAMLKEEVDDCSDKYGLDDIQENINHYFHCIKKMYILLSSYKILDYHKASTKILNFAQEIKMVDFKNLKGLTLTLYRNLLTDKLRILSKNYNYITLEQLSGELNIAPPKLVQVLKLIAKDRNNPIKKYDPKAQLFTFK